MRLTNYHNTQIFWRIFDKRDTIHFIGYKQDTLKPNGDWTNNVTHPGYEFQLEIKRGDDFIQTAGAIYNNDSEGIVVNDGHSYLETDYALLHLEIDDDEKTDDALPIVFFADQRNYPLDTSFEITVSIELSETGGVESQSTNSSSFTDTKTNTVGGSATVSGGGDQVKAAITANFSLSDSVTNGIQSQVALKKNRTLSSVYKETKKYTQVYRAGKILVMETSQTRRSISGRTPLGPDIVEWIMPFQFTPSVRWSEFENLEDMQAKRPALKTEYDRQFP